MHTWDSCFSIIMLQKHKSSNYFLMCLKNAYRKRSLHKIMCLHCHLVPGFSDFAKTKMTPSWVATGECCGEVCFVMREMLALRRAAVNNRLCILMLLGQWDQIFQQLCAAASHEWKVCREKKWLQILLCSVFCEIRNYPPISQPACVPVKPKYLLKTEIRRLQILCLVTSYMLSHRNCEIHIRLFTEVSISVLSSSRSSFQTLYLEEPLSMLSSTEEAFHACHGSPWTGLQVNTII